MDITSWQEEDFQAQAITWRRAFHEDPEISYHEDRTQQKIAHALQDMGLEPVLGTKHHGVTATITGDQAGPTVALRADMDALQVNEITGLPFKSKNQGIMHACGHDLHMAILLTAALRLLQNKSKLQGSVKLLFQPSEEMTPDGGAKFLIEDGWLNEVQGIFGLHVWPDLPVGKIGVKAGPLMAASDRFKVKILGKTSHAGHPNQGVDAIMATADFLQALSHIVSRRISPLATATINVGKLEAGTRYNVVPGEANLEGTIRNLNETTRAEIPELIRQVLDGMKISAGIGYQMEYFKGYPVLNNWKVPAQLAAETVEQFLGPSALATNIEPDLTAEDFGRYLQVKPGCFCWLGCHTEGTERFGLHSAQFCPDEKALHLGSQFLAELAIRALTALHKGIDFSK